MKKTKKIKDVVNFTDKSVYYKFLSKYYSKFDRNISYALDNSTKVVYTYDVTTSRISAMSTFNTNFGFNYMKNSNLQSGITYPNGVIKTIDYEQKRDLITAISYQNQDKSLLSSYSYTNDVLGQRVNKEINYLGDIKNINYGYNPRSEVISATDPTLKQAFDYDNIGNRIFAKNNDIVTNYTTNHLNQYTSISSDFQKSSSSLGSFAPVFDTDGNQLQVKSSTGVWDVEYNGENRPIKFTQDNKTIEMSYDYMGRRVEYISSENDVVNQHAKFVYNDYVLVQELSNANILLKEFVWDPTAGQATTPLVFKSVQNNETFFYTQDANKNIAELVFADITKGVATHYEYDSFGNTIIATNSSLSISNTPAENIASLNPFKFSSEYHDSTLGLVYYNYRHYNPNDGRWINRDPIAEEGGYNLYGMCRNNLLSLSDVLGRTAIAIGAGVGTVICPGPGTLIGIGVGAVITVGVIVIYHFKCETKTDATDIVIPTTQCPKKGECNPCIPPAGTISTHRIDLTGAAHNGIPTPHSHMKFVNQSPYPSCTCYWNKFDSNPFEDAIKPLYDTNVPPGGGGPRI